MTRTRAERRWPPAKPFTDAPPKVAPGDPVEIRTAIGDWRPAVARSAPRYDFDRAIGRWTYLTVAVTSEAIVDAFGHPVNWPAEHVRPATTEGDHHAVP